MDSYFEKLGLATRVLVEANLSSNLSCRYLTTWIMPAIAHEQICFAFDDAGRPLAFWTWAYLASDVERRLLALPKAELHISEWNEGDRLWIIDFVAPHGHLRSLIEYMHRFFAQSAPIGYSFRRGPDGLPRKINCWKADASSYLNRSTTMFRLADDAFAESKSVWEAKCN